MAETRERKSVITDIISTSATPNPKEALVFTKMSEMGVAIIDFFNDFTKVTDGAKSIADDNDGTLFFLADAYKGMLTYPEILSGTFNKADFTLKIMGLFHFFLFKSKVKEVLDSQWNTSVVICKTDAMYYANEFYAIITKEAKRDNKYKPLADSLAEYYKRTKQTDPDAAKKALLAKSKKPTTE
jgi:hypothetical protein